MQVRQEPLGSESWLQALNSCPTSISLGQVRVEVIYHGYAARHPDNQPHRHSFFEVCLVVRGTGAFVVGEQVLRVEAGDVFIARPGVVHQIVSTSRPEMELYWIAYQLHHIGTPTDEVAALLDRFALAPTVVARDDGRCAALWAALRTLAGSDKVAGVAEQLAWLTGSLVTAIAQLVAPGPVLGARIGRQNAMVVHQALRYIEDNLARPLSPSEVAKEVGLSQRHFTRLFTAHTGCTFHAYVNRARIDRATARLQSSRDSIKEIAAEVGFSDVHYFARTFSRIMGLPPGQIRRAGRPRGRSVHTFGEFV